ncbi:alpha/beta hydrolase [Ottowia sp. GY511]|uniref:Alpha/beta fold hydrolase n=1 Tax=Ottowia flava TaxID=2675430 RepID=A0ABW4KPK5_9BURK|nr:alpha/beta hydrolase [Ottowia sp. GY511]TXK32830.1 alpha/beta hydrolase [Ottowia sp. GY511]
MKRCPQSTTSPWTWLVAAATAASLAACGGGDDADGGGTPDPLQAYRDQVVQWGVCDATALGPQVNLPDGVGERLQCADVRAPLDWAKPDRGDVSVAVMRLKSMDPAQRKGSILFNPGGPGEDGLWLSQYLIGFINSADPATPVGAKYRQLASAYDMVGFSPRGTGSSVHVLCQTNEVSKFVDPTPLGTQDVYVANASYNASKYAIACARNPVTPFVNTDATVRDMDLIRGLLGDAKLNYVGYSYGTWLGAWYASLFPDHAGRMVLDSSIDFSGNLERALVAKPVARQIIEDRILAPYAARHAAYYQLGASAGEVSQMINGLSPRVQALLGGQLAGDSYSVRKSEKSMTAIAAARGLDAVLRAAPSDADAGGVVGALAKTVFIAGGTADATERNQAAMSQAIQFYNQYRHTWVNFPAQSISDSGGFWPVTCNDSVATTDPAAWTAIVRAQAQASPRYFFSALGHNPCQFWGGPRTTKPDFKPLQSQKLLMVQSQFDSATPTPDALNMFAQLPTSHLVYVPGEYTHGVFPYQTACVDVAVVDYLMGSDQAPRQIDCPAKPLPQDAAASAAKAQSQASASEPARTHKDQEAADRLLDKFHEGLVPKGSAPR